MSSKKISETSPKDSSPDSWAFPREFFDRSIERGRLTHAYLLLGADTSQMAAFCRRLAQRLFSRPQDEPGQKQALLGRIESGNHPDFYHLQPETAGGKVLIELTREIRRAVGFSRFEAPYRVVVIEHAERMTEAAQNQVLKTLEEPPARTLLLLLAPTTAGLLPTVVSRCVPVRFETPSQKEIQAGLQTGEIAKGEMEWAARVAGSIERARIILERNAPQLNRFLIKTLSERNAAAADELAETLMESGSEGDTTQAEARWWLCMKLELLALIMRDALLASLDIEKDSLYNMQNSQDILRIGRAYTTDEMLDALALTAESIERIEKNVNMGLICDSIAQRLLRAPAG